MPPVSSGDCVPLVSVRRPGLSTSLGHWVRAELLYAQRSRSLGKVVGRWWERKGWREARPHVSCANLISRALRTDGDVGTQWMSCARHVWKSRTAACWLAGWPEEVKEGVWGNTAVIVSWCDVGLLSRWNRKRRRGQDVCWADGVPGANRRGAGLQRPSVWT